MQQFYDVLKLSPVTTCLSYSCSEIQIDTLSNCSVIRNPGIQIVFIPILQMLILACFQGGNIIEQVQMTEMEND